MDRLHCRVGGLELKNPLIAAAGEHMIDASGVERAIRAGAGAVVVKSTNESQAAKDQLLRAEYMAFGPDWRPAVWGAEAPADVTLASRSGLAPQSFDQWLSQAIRLDRLAREHDCLLVASLILADLDQAEGLVRQVEQAGLRACPDPFMIRFYRRPFSGRPVDRVRPRPQPVVSQQLLRHERCGGRIGGEFSAAVTERPSRCRSWTRQVRPRSGPPSPRRRAAVRADRPAAATRSAYRRSGGSAGCADG